MKTPRSRRTLVALGLSYAALWLGSGCAVSGTFVRQDVVQAPESAAADIDTRLLLVGDAGLPRLDGSEPVFTALATEAARLPDRTWVIFLGDNIYPDGLPPADHADRARAEERLRAQIDAVAPTGAQVVFVPGNHDYHAGGWAGMQRQRQFIEALGNPRLRALPAAGCPGPDVVDVGARARLVFLDSQWWLDDGDRPRDPTSTCREDSETEIGAALHDALAAGERRVVVLQHHPLASHGPHGGHFTWRQHLFPLVDAKPWAWLPLPVIGSLYPLARWRGIAVQDFGSGKYEHMQAALRRACAERPPLLFAAGHEHSLQILDRPELGLQLVSGAGTVARPTPVGRDEDTLLATSDPGFARLDVQRDGRVRLEIITVSERGAVARPLALWLPR